MIKIAREDLESDSIDKLTQAVNYLSITDKQANHTRLIDDLSVLKREIANCRLKVAVVERSQIKQNLLESFISDIEQKNCLVTRLSSPISAIDIIQNYDLALLIIEDINSLTTEEDRLIKELNSHQLFWQIIIVSENLQQSKKLNIIEKYPTELNVIFLNKNSFSKNNSSIISLLNKVKSSQKIKFKQKAIQTINRYFEEVKQTTWQQIQQDKDRYLLSKNPGQIQQIIDRLPHRCSRTIQNYLKIFKQNNNQNKLSLINPFLSDSLMHHVQNAVRDAEVTIQKTKQKTYLQLVSKGDRVAAFHTYIIDLCHLSLTAWLNAEWQKITSQYNNGGLDRLHQQLQLELQPLSNLAEHTKLLQPDIKPKLRLENYICLSALENNSKIDFDYHYTQSTWFRILIAIFVGASIYLLTQRLFGFILLLVQIINLLTGQDTKSVRLRQQTKEIKRIVDGKYQFLVRFLTDKIIQDIAIALDNIDREYLEQIDIIVTTANQKLQEIKQQINCHKEHLETLKTTHRELKEIFKD